MEQLKDPPNIVVIRENAKKKKKKIPITCMHFRSVTGSIAE